MIEELREKITTEVWAIARLERDNKLEIRWFREEWARHRGRHEAFCEAYKLVAGEDYKL